MRIGIVPSGDVRSPAVDYIDWIELDQPLVGAVDVDAIVADFRADVPDEWEKMLADAALAGVPVYHTKNLFESVTGRVELEHLSENSFGTLLPISTYLHVKHAIDRIAALGALVILWPVMLAIGFAIRYDSPGPALFRQLRMGHRGELFTALKFRTMRCDAEAATAERHQAITQDADVRVTKVGKVLRRLRVDELPQLINVLRGEMSWIGPRPEAQILSAWYEEEIPFYRYRHVVRPGITGWAQVNQGHVADVDDVKIKLHYDFYYIKNYSPWLDMLIVGRTIRTIITGFGAK